jgi:hypothetical protein
LLEKASKVIQVQKLKKIVKIILAKLNKINKIEIIKKIQYNKLFLKPPKNALFNINNNIIIDIIT